MRRRPQTREDDTLSNYGLLVGQFAADDENWQFCSTLSAFDIVHSLFQFGLVQQGAVWLSEEGVASVDEQDLGGTYVT